MALRTPCEDQPGKLAYQCWCRPDTTILVGAECDQSLIHCPWCTTLLVEPCIPDLDDEQPLREFEEQRSKEQDYEP